MALNKISGTPVIVDNIGGANFETKKMGINVQDEGVVNLIMKMFTDTYTDPATAVVREVISNAFDATMMVPEEDRKPIDVETPSLLSPNFKVTDYGVGMSRETVENVYINYLNSTKTNDFNMIGAYGLGAKAPLAYCDSFLVETTKDGNTTVFTLSRAENQNEASFLYQEDTGKPNGTTVTVPVKNKDFETFASAVKRYTTHHNVIDLRVDGVIAENKDKLVFIGDLLLDEDTGVTGRVWVKEDHVYTYVKNLILSYYRNYVIYNSANVVYSLSGWAYNDPSRNDYYRSRDEEYFVLELKPGVVDFIQSRDGIVNNARFEKLFMKFSEGFLGVDSDKTKIGSILHYAYDNMSDLQRVNLAAVVSRFDEESKTIVSIDNAYGEILFNLMQDRLDEFNPFLYTFFNKGNVHSALYLNKKRGRRFYGAYLLSEQDAHIKIGCREGSDLKGAYYNEMNCTLSNLVFGVQDKISWYSGAKKNIFVENTDNNSRTYFLNSRKEILDRYGDCHVVMLTGSVDKRELKECERVFPDFFNEESVIIDAKNLVSLIKEIRREHRKTVKKQTHTLSGDFNGRVFPAFNNQGEFVEYMENPQNNDQVIPEEKKIALSDIGENDLIFLMSNFRAFGSSYLSDIESVFIGAVNAGEDVYGKNIIVLHISDSMGYEYARALAKMGEKRFFVSDKVRSKYKSFAPIILNRTFKAAIFTDDLQSLSSEDLCRAYLHIKIKGMEAPFINRLLTVMLERKNVALEGIVTTFTHEEINPLAVKLLKSTYVQLEDTVVGKEKACKLNTFVSILSSIFYGVSHYDRYPWVRDEDYPILELCNSLCRRVMRTENGVKHYSELVSDNIVLSVIDDMEQLFNRVFAGQ